jgi:hypothetical protein
MRTEIHLQPLAKGRLVGMRSTASPLRAEVEQAISLGADVVLDFGGLDATQSFVDELVGMAILRHGPDILGRMEFKNCTESVRAIVRFVAADRADQYCKGLLQPM